VQDSQELDRFARALVELVRDRSIVECDRLASGAVFGPTGNRWHELLADDGTRAAVVAVVPDIVDHVLFELLNAVDNDQLRLGWECADGTLVPLNDVGGGEMGGWLVGPDAWRERYSSQRIQEV
jgi:hypothetical protein